MITNAFNTLKSNRTVKSNESPSIGGFHLSSNQLGKSIDFDFCLSEMEESENILSYELSEPDRVTFPKMGEYTSQDFQQMFQANDLEVDLYIDYEGCDDDLQLKYINFIVECVDEDGNITEIIIPENVLKKNMAD